MKRANFYLPDELIARLKRFALGKMSSASAHLRKALMQYLDREDRKGRKP